MYNKFTVITMNLASLTPSLQVGYTNLDLYSSILRSHPDKRGQAVSPERLGVSCTESNDGMCLEANETVMLTSNSEAKITSITVTVLSLTESLMKVVLSTHPPSHNPAGSYAMCSQVNYVSKHNIQHL